MNTVTRSTLATVDLLFAPPNAGGANPMARSPHDDQVAGIRTSHQQ